MENCTMEKFTVFRKFDVTRKQERIEEEGGQIRTQRTWFTPDIGLKILVTDWLLGCIMDYWIESEERGPRLNTPFFTDVYPKKQGQFDSVSACLTST